MFISDFCFVLFFLEEETRKKGEALLIKLDIAIIVESTMGQKFVFV